MARYKEQVATSLEVIIVPMDGQYKVQGRTFYGSINIDCNRKWI
ncbi:MAG: hypothetical protein WAL98_20200 [Desulfatiglandaceae bacterium]